MKATGKDAYLWGKSVVALLGLTPTDPARIWVAFPSRVRRDIGAGVIVLGMRPDETTAHHEGTHCQRTVDAVRAAAPRIGHGRPTRGGGKV